MSGPRFGWRDRECSRYGGLRGPGFGSIGSVGRGWRVGRERWGGREHHITAGAQVVVLPPSPSLVALELGDWFELGDWAFDLGGTALPQCTTGRSGSGRSGSAVRGFIESVRCDRTCNT